MRVKGEESRLIQLLAEHYGIRDVRPGQKTICPRCRGHHFSIKANAEIATCWDCGFKLFHDSRPDNPTESFGLVANTLREIACEFHRELKSQLVSRNDPNYNARSYLEVGRGISPDVIESMDELGAVPDCADEQWFKRYFDPVDAALEADAAEEASKFPDKDHKARGWTNFCRRRLEWWRDRRDDLIYKVTANPQNSAQIRTRSKQTFPPRPSHGFLVFWYTDNKLRITGAKFRRAEIPKPGTEKFPFPWSLSKDQRGLFGLGLFTKDCKHGGNILIVEGEVNVLSVQSLAARMGKDWGNVAGTGSNCTVDAETAFSERQNVFCCYDHDKVTDQYPRGAGYKVVEELSQRGTIKCFTTPGVGSDIDSYISGMRAANVSDPEIDRAIAALVDGAVTVYRPYDAVKKQLSIWRSSVDEKGRRVPRWKSKVTACEIIAEDLVERGNFYRDSLGNGWYHDGDTRKMFEVVSDNPNMTVILSRYGIVDGDELHSQVSGHLRAHALREGELVEPRKFSWYQPPDGEHPAAVYVYNGGDVFKVTPEKIEIVPNGTDGVLFEHDPSFVPVNYIKEWANTRLPGMNAFDACVLNGMSFSKTNTMTDRENKLMIKAWFMAFFFGGMVKAKPIMAMIGEPGSGKTLSLVKVLLALSGGARSMVTMASDIKDFDTTVMSTSPLMVLDNVDGPQPHWLPDRIASIATGITISMRVLFTTKNVVQVTPDLWIAFTSFSPMAFRRQDIADRLIITELERYSQDRIGEDEIREEVLEARPMIWTEALITIRAMLRELFDEEGKRKRTTAAVDQGYRMATFQDLSLAYARVNGCEQEMADAFAKLGQSQRRLASMGDEWLQLLSEWADGNYEQPGYSSGCSRRGDIWTDSKAVAMGMIEIAERNKQKLKKPPTSHSFAEWAKRNEDFLKRVMGMERFRSPGRPTKFRFSKHIETD